MERIIFSNYHWEKDEHGKDHYDYARENIFDQDEDHRYPDTDYYDSDQLCIEGLQRYTCPICGDIFTNLADAKQCCRDQKWETADDVPDDWVNDEVYFYEEWDWREAEADLKRFIDKSPYGFLLCGTVGRWNGSFAGGYFVREFDDLDKCWQDCDYIKIYDEDGHLHIYCSHHDGNNSYEIKELTAEGAAFRNKYEWDMDDRELHKALWENDNYTQPAYYAHKMWGCEKED